MMIITYIEFIHENSGYKFRMDYDGEGGDLYDNSGMTIAVVNIRDNMWQVGIYKDCTYSHKLNGLDYKPVVTASSSVFKKYHCIEMASFAVNAYLKHSENKS